MNKLREGGEFEPPPKALSTNEHIQYFIKQNKMLPMRMPNFIFILR